MPKFNWNDLHWSALGGQLTLNRKYRDSERLYDRTRGKMKMHILVRSLIVLRILDTLDIFAREIVHSDTVAPSKNHFTIVHFNIIKINFGNEYTVIFAPRASGSTS